MFSALFLLCKKTKVCFMKEKLQEYALMAEIIGSIAIVVSLLYVGLEINQNSKEVRASNRQSISSRVEIFTLAVANNPMMFAPFEGDYEDLPEERQVQLSLFNAAMFRNTEEAYLMYLEGLLSEEYWLTRASNIRSRLEAPHAAAYFSRNRLHFTARFREWIESGPDQ